MQVIVVFDDVMKVSWTGGKQFSDEHGVQTNYSVTDYMAVGGSEYRVVITQLLPSVQYLVAVSGIIHSPGQAARIVDSKPVIVQTKRGGCTFRFLCLSVVRVLLHFSVPW